MRTDETVPLPTLSRREFLHTSARAALAASLLTATSPARAARSAKRWLVTARDATLKHTGQADCWSAMQVLGVDGAEVDVNEALGCSSLFHPDHKYGLATEDSCRQVRDECEQHGKTITAFCMHNRLDERLEAELDWARKLVRAAVTLKVDVIRIDVYPRKLTGDQVLPFAINACRQLCETAAGTPVRFGIENHGRITNDPDFLDKLFDGVGSSKLGLTMDFMNFYWFGHPLDDVYRLCKKFAPRAFHAHCKNLRYPDDQRNAHRPMGWEYAKYAAPVHEGDLDYRRIASILRHAGYHGDLCLENESLRQFPKEQHPDVLKKEIAWLRSAAQ